MEQKKPVTILMADDDADDRDFARSAMEEGRLANDLRFGEELLDYLQRRGRYADPKDSPRPDWFQIVELPVALRSHEP